MQNKTEPSRQEVWQMFDRIAPRYDFLNRTLSGGIDTVWRKKLAQFLPSQNALKLLDLATGTGDVLLTLCDMNSQIIDALGLDLSEGMLEIGKQKIAKTKHASTIKLDLGDACHIPCKNNSFDVITISFGIRNVLSVPVCLEDMFRVLKPGGRALVLEFSRPHIWGFRQTYFWYLRHILPQIGGLISGDSGAYKYLNQTIETFPSGQTFSDLMIDANFRDVGFCPLSGGIATIYFGDKPIY